MIFDCHTHWGDCFTQRDGTDPARWLETLDRNGVTRAFVLPFAGLLHDGKIQQDNDTVAAACKASRGRMIPFCTVNTWYRDDAVNELQRCLQVLGFRGIKFHPWLQGAPITSVIMDEVCELACAHDAPILFHDGTPPFSLPSQVAILAKRHPRVRMILGHCGLLEHWREAICAMNAAPNLWGCLCSPHPAALKEIIRRCDNQRLVWGSDYGFTFHDLFSYRLNMMHTLGIGDDVLRAIFEVNPARLLAGG